MTSLGNTLQGNEIIGANEVRKTTKSRKVVRPKTTTAQAYANQMFNGPKFKKIGEETTSI